MQGHKPHFGDVGNSRCARWAVHASRTPQSSQRSNIPAPSPQPLASPADVEQLHGERPREDPFRWLQAGHRHPQVLRYLQQEHEYSKLQLRHLTPLRKELEQEVAELVWRQALMVAAQQPSEAQAGRHASTRFGGWEYRREPANSGSAARFRHLRVPCPLSAAVTLSGPQQQLHPEQQLGAGGPHDRPHHVPEQPQQQRPESAASSAMQATAGNAAGGSAQVPSGSPISQPAGRDEAPAATHCVLDEQQRASACGSPAAYGLHSFAPSPTFDMAAFSETTNPVPPGQRLPDRFQLHVVDTATGGPVIDPLPDVSGDVGWVALGNGSGSGGGEGGAHGGGGRMYFTRAAQRELWCMDVPPPPAPAASAGGAVRVFRDPDGQPIQLVQYGSRLYAETLGNTSVPLEIRLLGVACADRPTGPLGPGSLLRQPPLAEEGGSRGPAAAASAAGRLRPGPDAGVPLLPRRPGRQYSAFSIDLSAGPPSAGPEPAEGPLTASADGSAEGRAEAPGECGPLGSDEALLLWLSDLDRPNGCLLLSLLAPGWRAATEAAPPPEVVGNKGETAAMKPQAQTLPLELLPHDPALRIVHVDIASGGGAVLCVRAAVDARGDPVGRYELDELQLDTAAVWTAVAAAADSGAWRPAAPARSGPEPLPPNSSPPPRRPSSTAAAESGFDGGGSVGSSNGPYIRTASGLSVRRRRRTVHVRGPSQHVLRVLDWRKDGRVTLACSSMASPPTTSTIALLPYEVRHCPGMDGGGAAAGSDAAELVCGEADPRVVVERLWARSHDGVEVPITLCRPLVSEPSGRPAEGATMNGDACGDGGGGGGGAICRPRASPQPLLLRVYGAYGRDPPLDFQPALLPLLRRGVGVAVAHVRGGGQLGPAWYEAGRGGGRKANSALDLLAAARHLVAEGVTAPGLMCLEAESAGGWAAGPALNAAGSSLFRAAVLTVPTLDVVTSLLDDPSYGPYELGDPRADAALYRDVLRWSPYEGLRSGLTYPALLLLRIGLYDTNVPYWDPAKYMARLRSLAAAGGGAEVEALRVMQVKPSGHEAYDNVADDATFCAFVLWALGVWSRR
ncbi:hypothetical protein PLESTM_000458800 [Pleodorina starrii]|nr:hypothetical protein PLESTM_000458800 [Pleodorina starrii]